uniref:ADM2 protein n=1 Tax=Nothoprocta perdicaria TaxID=30464 RepID=A0A8C7EAD6_NOTPE
MRAAAPLALGCISLVLCLLELPGCRLQHHPRGALRHRSRPDPNLAPRHRPRPDPNVPPRHRSWLQRPRGPARLPHPTAPLALRGRRHLGGWLQPASLQRVGCVLGTCQVQNLSHRLWQLVGQPGRQDSSPMNPRSPHSYG